MGTPDYTGLVELYLRKTLKTRRKILVSDDVGDREVRINKRQVLVSTGFIGAETDLPELRDRIADAIDEFDTREERERRATIEELSSVVTRSIMFLARLNAEEALHLLENLHARINQGDLR
jgi:hypothetical protein